MAKHVQIVMGDCFDGCTESDTQTLAKKVYDIVNSASSVHHIAIAKDGMNVICLIYYETT